MRSSSRPGELAQDAALGLTPKAQQDEVVPGQQRVDDLGEDGVLIADDAGEQRLAGAQPGQEVAPDLFPDGAAPEGGLRPAAVLEFT